MADVYTRIGYIKGATGAQGERGLQGDPGQAATIEVGSVTTVPYGQTANVQNSGTSSAAVLDFTIPQGRPGEQTTDMENLTLGSITTSSAEFPIPAVGETGKVLWGKVVKWFDDMSSRVTSRTTFRYRMYRSEYTIAANGTLTLTNADFGIEDITNYQRVAITSFSSDNVHVAVTQCNATGTAGTSTTMRLKNVASTQQTGNAVIRILYSAGTVIADS